jgi:AraC-like DNA-binding protein
MPPSLHSQTLYRNDVLSVHAVRCRPEDHRCGGEEVSATPGLAFVRRGAFVKHVGGRECLADPHQVVFFADRQPYRVSHPVAGGDDCLAIHFTQESLRSLGCASLLRRQDRREPVFVRQTAPVRTTQHLKQQVLRWLMRLARPAPDLRLDEMLCELVEEVIQGAETDDQSDHRAETAEAHQKLVFRTKALLNSRFTERLPLAELARDVSASPFHLCRVFRQGTGLSLHAYRLQLRLRTALEHLAEGERDTTLLALRLGFSSRGHLSDSFRRVFGMSIEGFRQIKSVARFRELSKILGAQCP